MRVVLVGPSADRDRLRPRLQEAGLEIAGEFVSPPAFSDLDGHIDAVVTAPPRERQERGFGSGDVSDDLVEPLTPREQEVLALVAEGLANKAIAAALDI